MLQEHHMNQNGMQRNPRMGIQQMGVPLPNQRGPIVMGMPGTGVIVTVPHGPGPALIPAQSLPQQQQQQQQPNQPKPLQQQSQMYHFETQPNTGSNETDHQQQSSHLTNQEQQQMSQHSPNTNTASTPNPPLANIKEKTPMCLVNELARYNKIQHQYRLTGEQGPAHKKIFTVTLKLGKEEYEAEGPSIKKAQHSAAAKALSKTEFKHPPPKSILNRSGHRQPTSGIVTPTVQLNALAMKRGERAVYVLEGNSQHQGYMTQPGYFPRNSLNYPQAQPRYNGYARGNVRNHYGYDSRYYGQYRPNVPHHNQGDPYTVRLRVGDREYPGTIGYGHGSTVQAARHDAAAKAIDYIKQIGGGGGDTSNAIGSANGQITEPEESSIQNDINSDLKSPISLVYEIALKRNLNVIFEVLSEKGPPHMKVFVTQCRVGNFESEGEGNGKKISKKRAAEKMLEELSKLPPLLNLTNVNQLKRKRVSNKKKTRNLIKVNTDKPAEVAEEINPISRLIQIQQANKEREPIYTVLEERGAPRRREFVIEASVNGHSCTGVGPNKKVAKRNAAEALLAELGHTPSTSKSPQQKIEKDDQTSTHNEKNRKVTFVEQEKQPIQQPQNVGGSGGRQLVPGVLLVTEQNAGFSKPKNENAQPEPSTKTAGQTSAPPMKNPPSGVRSKDQLLYLAQLMNIQVLFSDFPKANHEMYLTLVSLGTNPSQVCHGEGPTTEASHERAAMEALKVLSELGLDIAANKDHSQNKE